MIVRQSFRCSLTRAFQATGLTVAILSILACDRTAQPRQTPPNSGEARLDQQPVHGIEFEDIARRSGIQFTYRNGMEAGAVSMVEMIGGGVGVLDYDLDDLPDLCFAGGGTIQPDVSLAALPCAIFRQVESQRFQDETSPARIASPEHYSHGVSIADYDNDGFPDILVTGYGGLTLYRNQGDGTFESVAHDAGLHDDQWSTSAGWGDVDGDGSLDLYIVHYVDWNWQNHPECKYQLRVREMCPPRRFSGLDDTLYLSNGDGTFADHTKAAGIVPKGKGLGVLLADLDDDTDLDIYVANDMDDNFVYTNDGTGSFEEVGLLSGAATDDRGHANGSMGIALLDYNDDRQPDIWVTNYENESFALYENRGRMLFRHQSQSAGIFALGSSYVGFGTIAADLDGDSNQDLVVTNGHVLYRPQSGFAKQLPLVLKGGGGQFQRITFSSQDYLGQAHLGRGLAKLDVDRDGDPDLAFTNSNEPVALLRNDTQRETSWIGFRLIGVGSNRDGIGASLALQADDAVRCQSVSGGGSYLSTSDRSVLFTIKRATLQQPITLNLRWPSGKKQTVALTELNRYFDVRESE